MPGSGEPGPPLVVCAPNAFKGTLSANAAAQALARGVRDAGFAGRPLAVADGGDGTLDVLVAAAPEGWVQQVRVAGPTGRARSARLGWISPGIAVVEMAEAAGLRLLGHRRDPMGATSAGVGGLILAALDGGAHRVLVGVGGSASTDGGAGILAALGARLLDRSGRAIGRGGGALAGLVEIDLGGVDARLLRVEVEVAVDVRNPLAGPEGAAHVYAAQKGADSRQVSALDAGLRHLATLVERAAARPGLAGEAGAGAAGGAAFALAAIGARLLPGAALVCDQVGLDAALAGAGLVITGEGRLDSQTAAGKAPAEVALRARRAGIPCVAVCGSVAGGTELFSAAIALDSLSEEPERRVRSLLRTAGAQAASLSG